MTLYLIGRQAAFAQSCAAALPCTVQVQGAEKIRQVCLDGTPLALRAGEFTLPAGLGDGVHTLTVNGVAAESIRVRGECVHPMGVELRALLPVLVRLPALEARVRALEAAAREREINWLK